MGKILAIGVPNASGSEKLHLVVETKELRGYRRTALKICIAKVMRGICNISQEQVHLVPSGTIPRSSSGKVRNESLLQMIHDRKIEKHSQWFLFQYLTAKAQRIGRSIRRDWILTFSKSGVRSTNTALEDPVLQGLQEIFAQVMLLPLDQVDPAKSFSEFNIESDKLIELTEKFSQKYGNVSSEDLQGFENLLDLRSYLGSRSQIQQTQILPTLDDKDLDLI